MNNRGTGSVYRTKRGNYRAEINLSGQRVTAVFNTRPEAKTWLAQQVTERSQRQRQGGVDPNKTFADAAVSLLAFWATGIDRVRTESTIDGYKRELDAVLRYWGSVKITTIRKTDVERYAAAMEAEGLSTSTKRNRLNKLSQMLQRAVTEEWIAALPFKVQRPALTLKSKRSSTSEDHVNQLIEAAKTDPRMLTTVLLAADAGLRRSEIPRLRGEDINLDRRTITVAVRSERDRTKSGHARTIPILTNRLFNALAAMDPQPGRPVLLNLTDASSVSALANRLWRRAGLGKTALLHELRHRFVSVLLNNGVPVVKVQSWAGHADVKTTMGYCDTDETPTETALTALEFHTTSTQAVKPGPVVVRFNRRKAAVGEGL